MISPLEIIRGNIVSFEGKIYIVEGVREFILLKGRKEWIGGSMIDPEPITEVWLEKFQFECDGVTWSRKNVWLAPGGGWFDVWAHGLSNPILAQISYVHQLQMLFFCITGEHLIIPKLPK